MSPLWLYMDDDNENDNDDDGYYDEYNNYYDVLNLTQFAQFTEVYIVLSLESIQKRLLTRTFSLR